MRDRYGRTNAKIALATVIVLLPGERTSNQTVSLDSKLANVTPQSVVLDQLQAAPSIYLASVFYCNVQRRHDVYFDTQSKTLPVWNILRDPLDECYSFIVRAMYHTTSISIKDGYGDFLVQRWKWDQWRGTGGRGGGLQHHSCCALYLLANLQ